MNVKFQFLEGNQDIIRCVASITTTLEYIDAGTYLGVASGIGDDIGPHSVIDEGDRIDIHYDFLHIITVHITTSIQDGGGDNEGTQTSLVVANSYISVLLVKLQFCPILIGGGVNVHGYHQTLCVISDGGIDVKRAMIQVDDPEKLVQSWCQA